MSLMLPPAADTARNISGVAAGLFAAVRGESAILPPARSVVLVVIDGLGAIQLRQHAGHARALTAGMAKKDILQSVFPTTTAAALTSITTGVWPGEHGLIGYQVVDPERDVLVNQLSGWESDGIDPLAWQPVPTIFETATAASHPAFAVGIAAYARSGFTKATLRGAQFVPAKSPAERVQTAYALAEENPGALVYCYLPEADQAGHKHGVDSEAWTHALENIDAALAIRVPPHVGVIVTSDHGMVDVPPHRHAVLEDGDRRFDGVRHIGGEPRMMHVYLEPEADAARVLATWREDFEGVADVMSRDEAIAAGLYGPVVTQAARARMGDIQASARGLWALYNGTAADQRGRGMIGQHGALTPEERQVPHLRFGVFAR